MAAKRTKKKKTTRGRPKKEQQNQEIRGEIIILIALAICILLVLSNFGMGGIVGEAVSSVLFGLFGTMAYIFPFAALHKDRSSSCPVSASYRHPGPDF